MSIFERIAVWVLSRATFKLYTSTTPQGRRIGGHDDPKLPDLYIILDVRVSDRILVFGYFQTT